MTCPSGRAGKLQNPDFHQGLPTPDPVFLPWQKTWPFTRRELCQWPCPLSWASEKLLRGISSVDFDLGKVLVWTFVKTEEWDKMNSQVTFMAVKSVILFQDFMKLKLFTWNAWYRKYHRGCKELFIWDHLTTHCDWKIWERERGHRENYLIYFTHAIILFWCFISKLLFTALFHIKQCSLGPPHFIMLLSLMLIEIIFHFEPNCFFVSVANRPSECWHNYSRGNGLKLETGHYVSPQPERRDQS